MQSVEWQNGKKKSEGSCLYYQVLYLVPKDWEDQLPLSLLFTYGNEYDEKQSKNKREQLPRAKVSHTTYLS